jgi:hypothetical protein
LDYQQLKAAKTEVLKQRRIAYESRQQFLNIHQEAMILADNKKLARITLNIAKAERRRNCFRTIKRKLQPHRSTGGISHLIIDNADGTHSRIDDRDAMNLQLHERNRRHFRQAHGTPFTIPPLLDLLGYDGCTDAAHDMLQGRNIHHDIHPAARSVLLECSQVRDPISSVFPINDMIKEFSRWRESTSTSPSGKHLGFYKSMIAAYKHCILTRTNSGTSTNRFNCCKIDQDTESSY